MNNFIYKKITDRIIERMQKGVIPWNKPWTGSDRPKNGISQKSYKGFNYFMLSSMGYSSPTWYTFNQIKAKKGSVKKGEKATPIIYFDFIEKYDEKENKKISYPILKHFLVFNLEQTTLEQEKIITYDNKKIDKAEKIASKLPIKISNKYQRATYSPVSDTIEMPKLETFKSAENYYAVLFHELIHATGHKSRLDRENFYSNSKIDYSFEELVAEMGACFLCHEAEISNKVIENQTAYIQGWITALKNDPKMLIKAAAKAEKASEYIINYQ